MSKELSVPQAAAVVGLTRQGVIYAIRKKYLKARRIGGHYVIERTDLTKWREITPAPGRKKNYQE